MKYKSYSKEVKARILEASETSLEAVGLEAQRDVTLKVTSNEQVDTGRMRASVTYIAGDKKGGIMPDRFGQTHNTDLPRGSLAKNTLHVGTNVKYAIWQEKKRPFLGPSVKNNMKKYTNMMNDIFIKLMRG